MTNAEYIKTIPTLTNKELLEELDYCGYDSYYRTIREPVIEEITKRLNRIAELEKENAELKHIIATLRQEKDNVSMHAKAMEVVAKTRSDQLTKANSYLKYFIAILKNLKADKEPLVIDAENFLKESEVEK